MKNFVITWYGGQQQIIAGNSISNAISEAHISASGIAQIIDIEDQRDGREYSRRNSSNDLQEDETPPVDAYEEE